MTSLHVAVIGMGRMGTNHARVLSDLPGVRLAAICDESREIAERTAKRFSAEGYCTDIRGLLKIARVDAAIVAVPTVHHLPVAKRCLQNGANILVEKPMAPSVEECDEMIADARRLGRTLMVGHVERFNPVILKLKQFLEERFLGDLYHVDTARTGPFPRRLYGSKDGVIIDLAVHDLDLIAYLFGPIKQVYANQVLTPDRFQDIHARVLLKTVSGIVGTCQVSWISPRRERSVTVYGDKGILACNLNEQEVWYYENGDVEIDYSDNYYQNVLMGRVSEGKVVKFPIKKGEPLRGELSFFCDRVRERTAIDPFYGREAVRYSLAVLQSARDDRIVRVA
jgi:UDP-N-acetylglucosamine 3-dehydrogenase